MLRPLPNAWRTSAAGALNEHAALCSMRSTAQRGTHHGHELAQREHLHRAVCRVQPALDQHTLVLVLFLGRPKSRRALGLGAHLRQGGSVGSVLGGEAAGTGLRSARQAREHEMQQATAARRSKRRAHAACSPAEEPHGTRRTWKAAR